MCAECRCNSLADNNWKHLKMLGFGSASLQDIPRLRRQAELAERAYRSLMEQIGWTPEQLFEITGYRILVPQNQSANLTI